MFTLHEVNESITANGAALEGALEQVRTATDIDNLRFWQARVVHLQSVERQLREEKRQLRESKLQLQLQTTPGEFCLVPACTLRE